jgi:hypothetical protein
VRAQGLQLRDHRNWDMAAEYGRYVPASLILDACVVDIDCVDK